MKAQSELQGYRINSMKKSHHKHDNFSWQRWLRGGKTQTSSCLGCDHAHFLFVFAVWSAFFIQLRSIQPLWKRAFCLLCLVDDFVGELMRGDAQGGKQQMRRNKDQSVFFFSLPNAPVKVLKVGCVLLKLLCSSGRCSPSCHCKFTGLNLNLKFS